VPVRAWRFKSSHPHRRFERNLGTIGQRTIVGQGSADDIQDESLDDEQVVDEIFWERDSVRLAIRGMVLIDAILDDAIDDAFEDGLPAELEGAATPLSRSPRGRVGSDDSRT
jgi:hypothetical protein